MVSKLAKFGSYKLRTADGEMTDNALVSVQLLTRPVRLGDAVLTALPGYSTVFSSMPIAG
jgi:hypothetical protein